MALPPAHLERLQQATAFETGNFYSLFQEQVNSGIFGGAKVQGWSSQRHGKL